MRRLELTLVTKTLARPRIEKRDFAIGRSRTYCTISRPDLGIGNETATGCGHVPWCRVSCMTKIWTEGAAKAQPNTGGFPGTQFLVVSSIQNVSKLEPAQSVASELEQQSGSPSQRVPDSAYAASSLQQRKERPQSLQKRSHSKTSTVLDWLTMTPTVATRAWKGTAATLWSAPLLLAYDPDSTSTIELVLRYAHTNITSDGKLCQLAF